MSPKELRTRTSTVSSDGSGTLAGIQVIAHAAEAGVQIEPGRDPGAHGDVHLAACRLGDDEHR